MRLISPGETPTPILMCGAKIELSPLVVTLRATMISCPAVVSSIANVVVTEGCTGFRYRDRSHGPISLRRSKTLEAKSAIAFQFWSSHRSHLAKIFEKFASFSAQAQCIRQHGTRDCRHCFHRVSIDAERRCALLRLSFKTRNCV